MLMKCRYIYKGHTFDSEAALDDFLIEKQEYESLFGDLVFSRGKPYLRTKKIIEQEIKKDAKYQKELMDKVREARKRASSFYGDEILEFRNPYIGVNKFLSGLAKNEAGDLIIPEFRIKEYWNRRVESWTKPLQSGETIASRFTENEIDIFFDGETHEERKSNAKLLNEQETKELIQLMESKWKYQATCGTVIHQILQYYFSKDDEGNLLGDKSRGEIIDHVNKNLQKDITEALGRWDPSTINPATIEQTITYADTLKQQLRREHGDKCDFYPELCVTAKSQKLVPGKPQQLFGIIDLLVVDKNGQTHIYDFKSSPKEYGEFDSAKKRAYTYQLAMYGKLLKKYKLDYRNGTFGILPIQFKDLQLANPDEAHLNPTKAKFSYSGIEYPEANNMIQRDVHNDIFRVDSYGNQPVLDILDAYLPEETIIDAPSDEIIETVEGQIKEWFPEYTQFKAKSDIEITEELKKEGALSPVDREGKKLYVYKPKGVYSREIVAESESELVEKVKKQQERYEKNKEWMAETVIKTIQKSTEPDFDVDKYIESIETKNLLDETGFRDWFRSYILRYCNGDWKVVSEIPALKHFGIILLRNERSQQFDIIKMSNNSLSYNIYDHNKETKRKNKNHLLTAAFQPDINEQSNQKSLMLEAYRGNIELIETMLVLNNIPMLFEGEYSGAIMGNIQVLNSFRGSGMWASNEELMYCWKKLSELKPLTKPDNISTGKVKFGTAYELAVTSFNEALEDDASFTLKEPSSYNKAKTVLDEGINSTVEEKIDALTKIASQLEKTYKIDKVRVEDLKNKPEYRLYYRILQAIASLRGVTYRQQIDDHDKWIQEKTIAGILERGVSGTYTDNPGNHLSETLNSITKLITQAYQNVRNIMSGKVAKIRKATEELKKYHSYTGLAQLGGNATDMYKKMVKEENGDLLFVNLNDPSLNTVERDYLKLILEIINENRFGGKYSKSDLENMRDSYDLRYYRVPLVRATAESRDALVGIDKGFRERLRRFNPKEVLNDLQERVNGIFVEDAEGRKQAERLFEMNNMFDRTEDSLKYRLDSIKEKGAAYFEHNLEMLAFKHTYAYESAKELRKVFPMMKAAMAYLANMGIGVNKEFKHDNEYMESYLRSSVKNQSIYKDDKFTQANLVASKIKQIASFMALAFSPVQGLYQSLQGLWIDTSLILRNIGISDSPYKAGNMMSAFKEVYSDLGHFHTTPTKCQLINEWMGVNDMDMNVYAERMRTDQYNKYNLYDFAYKFASRPDFYNRMTIIVAKMKADGVWDALEVVDGKLVYNWKKDKRFAAYANNKTEDPEYNNQRALYYTISNQFITENVLNPDGTLFKIGDPLPYAYTNQEAESMKSLCDLLYGYYSHEKKSLIHATFLGSLYMQMRTYWSGKKNQYLAPGGVRIQGKWEQAKDSSGKPLYYQLKEDGTIDYNAVPTTEVTNSPYYQWKGQWQEGILLTLGNIFRNGTWKHGFTDGIKDVWNNDDINIQNARRQNIIQFFSDLAFYFIIGSLIAGLWMADWDKELRKEAKESGEFADALQATAIHILSRSMGNSAEDFSWWHSIGNPLGDWSPFTIKQASNIYKRFSGIVFGDERLYDGAIKSFSATSQMQPLFQWINPKETE